MNDEIVMMLVQALRSYPCRCEFTRNKRGVPVWFPRADGEPGIERKLIRRCSKHIALEAYEAALAAEPKVVDETLDEVEPGERMPVL